MKGLALVLSPKGGAKVPPPSEPESKAAPMAEEGEESEGGSEMEYAKLASEAIAAGDHEAAAEALVSLVKCCKE